MILRAALIAALVLPVLAERAEAGTTLDAIRATGKLACGTVAELNDETLLDTHGNLSALGADICRAVAAAVLGPETVEIRSFPSAALAYDALQHGRIALLVGDTPNPGLARRYGIGYLTPVFFDAQGVMVHKDRGFASLKDLDGHEICYIQGTDAETGLHRAADRLGLKNIYSPFTEIGEMEAALVGGRCDAETADLSRLAYDRTLFHAMRHDFVILPDRLTFDPFAPAVRNGDPEWRRVVEWTVFALVQAAESGVTQANAEAQRRNPDLVVQTLLGSRRGMAWGLFLDDDWAFRAIRAVGNYDEVIARDTGAMSPLRLDPGPNRPGIEGGMMWSPPFR